VKIYIVVPEGLSIDEKGNYYASDYYMAALDKVRELGRQEDHIYLAPANTFGSHQPEDHFGKEYLQQQGVRVELIADDIPRTGYLDTLDNAVYLRRYLQGRGCWPLGEVVLVCNKPHKWRSYLLFSLCGYRVRKVIVSRPVRRTGRKMVSRLWFYDVPFVQYIYEAVAIGYNTMKWLIQKKT
jgi:uncharacterized SAM-binding protein YcdF (DUF218 family)